MFIVRQFAVAMMKGGKRGYMGGGGGGGGFAVFEGGEFWGAGGIKGVWQRRSSRDWLPRNVDIGLSLPLLRARGRESTGSPSQ